MQKVAKSLPLERDLAIDATRGIAILAVVIFHITRGFVSSGRIPPSFALSFADTFAYSFHVPTFLLIAGYLSFPRAGQLTFQLRRQTWFYHAYLLWSLVSWTLVTVASGAVNNPMNLHDLLFIPIVPIQHFWFLLALMLGTALLAVLRTPKALVAGCAVALVLAPLLQYMPSPLGAMSSVCMLLIGGLLRQTGFRPTANLPLALLSVAIVIVGAWWKLSAGSIPPLLSPARVLISLFGCYAAYSFASMAGAGRVAAALAYFGRHSLVIFLLHVIAGSGLRVILAHVAPGLHFSLAFTLVLAISLSGPLIFEMVARRIGVDGLLGLSPLFFNAPEPVAQEEDGLTGREPIAAPATASAADR